MMMIYHCYTKLLSHPKPGVLSRKVG